MWLEKVIANLPFSDIGIKHLLEAQLASKQSNIDLNTLKIKTEKISPSLKSYQTLNDAEKKTRDPKSHQLYSISS